MQDIAVEPHRAPVWLRPLIDAVGETASGSDSAADADAAVLVLFTGDAQAVTLPDNAAVLITHRHPNMRAHSGQMAFPGGRIDPEDLGPVDAALREAHEETGLERHRVIPLAVLDVALTGGSRRRVRPVIAYAADPGHVHPASEIETDDVFFIPVAQLIEPGKRLQVGFGGWSGPAFWAGCYLVWGFTGGIIARLLDAAGWSQPWDATTLNSLGDVLARSCNGERF